jgi:hypothetical protein
VYTNSLSGYTRGYRAHNIPLPGLEGAPRVFEVVPIGGGGLDSGIIFGFERVRKKIQVIAADPLLVFSPLAIFISSTCMMPTQALSDVLSAATFASRIRNSSSMHMIFPTRGTRMRNSMRGLMTIESISWEKLSR